MSAIFPFSPSLPCRVALIGCGALAEVFAANLPRVAGGAYALAGALGRDPARAEAFCGRHGCARYASLAELVEDRPGIAVEFAGGGAVRDCAEALLAAGVPLVAASVGALADAGLRDRLAAAARAGGSRLYLPCGAIGGLDLMRAYALMGEPEVEITSVKAPASLAGAPGLAGRALSQAEEETVFAGGVAEAIAGFPKNVNVAVAASLASGAPAARVTVVSRPGTAENLHRIRIACGPARATLEIASRPDPANPRSSASTAFSALALLESLASPVAFF
ncbi:MAG: DUF108 domain-containing protein [Duodenibacillus sp.]|nr:DUF108 domain-containing protein [Duodenibacillus sp.]